MSFLDALIRKNWIKPGDDVQERRFWTVSDDDRGKMFGVFSYPEKQMIYAWIQGPQSTSTTSLRGWARKHEQKNQSQ
ncbi:hypothetical protein ACPB4A_26765, partial [Escherichia coli]